MRATHAIATKETTTVTITLQKIDLSNLVLTSVYEEEHDLIRAYIADPDAIVCEIELQCATNTVFIDDHANLIEKLPFVNSFAFAAHVIQKLTDATTDETDIPLVIHDEIALTF
jgi:hypothetical protein